MRLQEEYFKRHSLPYNPIYHTKNTQLLLRNKSNITIMNILWKEPERTTGYYEIFYSKPIHNGYVKGEYFVRTRVDHVVEYEDYFSFITTWAKSLTLDVVQNINLASWEIFVYCFDGWIASNSLENEIFPTIDPQIPPFHREANINEFLNYLKTKDQLVYKIYNIHFKFKHESWLERLIKGDGCEGNFRNSKNQICSEKSGFRQNC